MRLAFFLLLSGIALPLEAQDFAAAGRIENSQTGGTCSAALIGPDIIVTAAHCVSEENAQIYSFRSSLPDSKPVQVERIVVHPFYRDFITQRLRRLRFDIAVGRLEAPLADRSVTPFPLGDVARTGEGLFLASWRAQSGPRPRLRRCLVIEGQVPGVVALGCRVRGGESGAPLVRLTDQGVELVAIVNSTARIEDKDVALAADVRLRVEPLVDQLAKSP
jgi:hypothetical protein